VQQLRPGAHACGWQLMKSIEAILDGPFRQEVVPEMSRATYMESCGLNPSSIAKGIIGRGNETQSIPKYTKHAYETYKKPTDTMKRGTLAHIMCFEPARVHHDVAVWQGKTRSGDKWKEFNKENAGKLIVRTCDWNDCEQMVRPLFADKEFRRYAEEGQCEVALFSETRKLQCRGQADWISTAENGALCDLKTAQDISDVGFGISSFRLRYDVKMGCYRRWLLENGFAVPKSVFFAVRNEEPWDATVIEIPDEVLDRGWQKADDCIRMVRQSLESGVWPGISGSQAVSQLWVPGYEMQESDLVQWGT